MLKPMPHSRYKCLGSLILCVLALVLFFASPLAAYTGRWVEITLCMVSIAVAGWIGYEPVSDRVNFLLTVILVMGVCALPWLLHIIFHDPADPAHSGISVIALITVAAIFIALAMHLGERAKSLYLLLRS